MPVSFSRSKGVYGGVNFDGTIVSTSDKWNRLYYGKPATAADILALGTLRNKHASELLNLVTAATRK